MNLTNNTDYEFTVDLINKNLIGEEIKNIYNPTGFHIFINFGNYIEKLSRNMKVHKKYDWTFWLGNSSWRLMKDNLILLGSEDDRSIIQSTLDTMIGLKFESISFVSNVFSMSLGNSS